VSSSSRVLSSEGTGTKAALGPIRARDAIGGHDPKGSSAEVACGNGGSPSLGTTTAGGATTSEVMASDGPSAPEVGPEVETMVIGETAIPVVTHEMVARDVVVSFDPTIGTSSSRPQKAAASGLANVDDDVMGEPEIILGHPSLIALGNISVDDVVGMAHWALTQAQEMLYREQGSINDER
jgi:hypothetical protein